MSYYGAPMWSTDQTEIEKHLRMRESTLMGTIGNNVVRANSQPTKPSFEQFKTRFRREYPTSDATEEEMHRAWMSIPSFSFRASFVSDAFVSLRDSWKFPEPTALPECQIEKSRDHPTTLRGADVLLGQIE